MSSELAELVVKECTPEEFKDCDLVFSGLDSDVAGDIGTYNTHQACLSQLKLKLNSNRGALLEGKPRRFL